MSRLYLRGERVWIGFKNPHGRYVRRPTGHTLKRLRKDPRGRPIWPAQVRDFQTKLDASLALGQWDLAESRPTALTLSRALEVYHAGEGGVRKPKTLSADREAVRRIVGHYGEVYLHEITEEMLYEFRTHLLRVGSPFTAAKCFRHLSILMNWAVRKGHLERNPVTTSVKVSPPRSVPISFTDHELAAVFDWLEEQGDRPMADQLRFLLLTGFRSNESCQLTWDAVDLKTGQIRHKNEKANRIEPFPVDRALEALIRAQDRAYGPYVFKYRHNSTLSHRMKAAVRALQLNPRYNVHTLKKTYVRHLVESGVPLPMLHNLAHHRSLQTTLDYYIAFDLNAKRRALEASRTRLGTKIAHPLRLVAPRKKK
jgi:integrase